MFLVTALGFVGTILFVLLLALLTRNTSQLSRVSGIESVEYLYNLSQTRSSDNLATIDLGRRWPAITLSHHLTSGRMIVVDVYNPQLMPSKSLLRARRQHYPAALSDPRLTWYDSNLDLLPLPDRSVSAVFLYHVLSEISEKGDQKALLEEIFRILEPNGRLLVAEFSNNLVNRLQSGLGVTHTKPIDYWHALLKETGFELQRTQTLHGAILCMRADKPSPYGGKQLSFDLDFEAF